MANLVKSPYPLFTDIDGSPLDNGYITISPLQAYWDKELTLPANDIRTKGGYPDNGGVTGQLYTEDTDYTITVRNKKDFVVYASSEAYDRNLFQAGIAYSPNRIASQELTSGTLSTSGWYTIAEAPVGTANGAMARIEVVSNGGRCGGCELAIRPTNTARNLTNTSISLLGGANSAAKSYVTDILGFRLATSDTEGNGGFKLQMNVNGSTTFNIQMMGNLGRSTLSGLSLVTPYLDNTPTLPDGVTPATFIEAGAEFEFNGQTFGTSNPALNGYKGSSDDILYCLVNWPEIPKQGTGLSLTLPVTALRFKDLGNVTSADVASFTISNFAIIGKQIAFQINQTGIATGMTTFTPAMAIIVGPNAKLTITG